MKKIESLNGYISLRKFEFKKLESVIIIPESSKDDQEFYQVIEDYPIYSLSKDDVVTISPYKYNKVIIDDNTFYLIKREDILAKIIISE